VVDVDAGQIAHLNQNLQVRCLRSKSVAMRQSHISRSEKGRQ